MKRDSPFSSGKEKDMESVLEFKHISKYFPGVKALDDICFKAYGGEVLAFLGEYTGKRG